MKPAQVCYTCNLTVSQLHYPKYKHRIPAVLTQLSKILKKTNVKAIIFMDVVLLLRLKQEEQDIYKAIKDLILTLDKEKHDIGVLINPEWESTMDFHQLDTERLLDIFAHAKQLMIELTTDEERERNHVVRILTGKIQPFMYLKEMYDMLGVKIDCSILPGIKKSTHFDYSTIQYGEIVRFTRNPKQPDRFGTYLGLPRGIFKSTIALTMQWRSQIKKLTATNPRSITAFIDPDGTPVELKNIPAYYQNKYKLLSPDSLPFVCFKKVMNNQSGAIKHVCMLESFIDSISPVTEQNLTWLHKSKHFEFISLSALVAKYSTTYNINFKR